jgi:hypothetical protein
MRTKSSTKLNCFLQQALKQALKQAIQHQHPPTNSSYVNMVTSNKFAAAEEHEEPDILSKLTMSSRMLVL